MADYPPFMNAYGVIPKILEAIKNAQTPSRFTQDFLKTKLNMKSSGARPIIPLLKKLDFLSSEGVPTERYQRFRNPSTSKQAMAEGIKKAYRKLYESHEYAHDLSEKELEGLVISLSGAEKGSGTVKAVVNTFGELKRYADFDMDVSEQEVPPEENHLVTSPPEEKIPRIEGKKFSLAYMINLNLPETTDIEVYNAIFKSLKEHILD